jgi:hypothetical protein
LKVRYYKPWYWYLGAWEYATPWAHIDGKSSGYDYSTTVWGPEVTAESQVASPLTMSLSGWYNRSTLLGRINVHIVNTDSQARTNTHIRYALTESGLHFNAPNGERIFGQVLRKFFSNGADTLRMQDGDTITIAGNATLDRGVNFWTRSSWNADSCRLVVFVQQDTLLSDSTRPTLQGSKIWVRNLTQTGVKTSPIVEPPATECWLSTPTPTPFKTFTTIRYSLPAEAPVSLGVYNLVGMKVRTLGSGRQRNGNHIVGWDGRNEAGVRVPGGVYFFELKTPFRNLTTRTVLVR